MIGKQITDFTKMAGSEGEVFTKTTKKREEQMSKEQGTGEQGLICVYRYPMPVHLLNITSFSVFYIASWLLYSNNRHR